MSYDLFYKSREAGRGVRHSVPQPPGVFAALKAMKAVKGLCPFII
jgi:hypothetical protein